MVKLPKLFLSCQKPDHQCGNPSTSKEKFCGETSKSHVMVKLPKLFLSCQKLDHQCGNPSTSKDKFCGETSKLLCRALSIIPMDLWICLNTICPAKNKNSTANLDSNHH